MNIVHFHLVVFHFPIALLLVGALLADRPPDGPARPAGSGPSLGSEPISSFPGQWRSRETWIRKNLAAGTRKRGIVPYGLRREPTRIV
jgi:hypothetical protein